MKNKSFIFILCILNAAAIAAIPNTNPAADYCIEMGYEYQINHTTKGDVGICKVPDGTSLVAWDFIAGKTGEEYGYCNKKGYKTKTVSDERCRYNPVCAVCVLENGTETEVTELMAQENNRPAQERKNNKTTSTPPTAKQGNATPGELPYAPAAILALIIVAVVFIAYRNAQAKKIDKRRREFEEWKEEQERLRGK